MTPLIYNLFPRLVGRMDGWRAHAERARRMGFNCIYVNPVSYPGFSGSLYAVKDYGRVCPDFLPAGTKGSGLPELKRVLAQFKDLGLKPVMDLVINHTAKDSDLTRTHPEWYVRDASGQVVSPHAIDPADARKVTVWGDLAEIDNAHSPDRDRLWDFWRGIVRASIELGWQGFRCDAAYKVPAALWQTLIAEARSLDPSVLFFAETLGCRLEETRATCAAGFDFLFNSVKYWGFDAPWAISQHNEFAQVAPSIGFPESHDTSRLFADTNGNLAVQRQRYVTAAIFSAGLLMPVGYELGFKKRVNVVHSTPADWEETGVDLTELIRNVNEVKLASPVLRAEGVFAALTPYDRATLVLEKSCHEGRMLFAINKDWHNASTVELGPLPGASGARLRRLDDQGRVQDEPLPPRVTLRPAEIAFIE